MSRPACAIALASRSKAIAAVGIKGTAKGSCCTAISSARGICAVPTASLSSVRARLSRVTRLSACPDVKDKGLGGRIVARGNRAVACSSRGRSRTRSITTMTKKLNTTALSRMTSCSMSSTSLAKCNLSRASGVAMRIACADSSRSRAVALCVKKRGKDKSECIEVGSSEVICLVSSRVYGGVLGRWELMAIQEGQEGFTMFPLSNCRVLCLFG